MQIDEDGRAQQQLQQQSVNGDSQPGPSGVNGTTHEKHGARRRGSFFTNTNFYVLLRLLEVGIFHRHSGS